MRKEFPRVEIFKPFSSYPAKKEAKAPNGGNARKPILGADGNPSLQKFFRTNE
jgi:hypothetical protein